MTSHTVPSAVSNIADLYLLLDTDVPFVQDGWRDGENIRQWMHDRFVEQLQNTGKRFQIIGGSWQRRQEDATRWVCDFIATFRRI